MVETIQQAAPGAAPVYPVDVRPYTKRQRVFQELMQNRELLLKNRLEVRHLMTPDPIVIAPTMTIEEMESLMRDRRVRHLLVGGSNGELIGVISDRDLRAHRGATAQQLMSFPVMTATPETPLNPAITFLVNESISCLPVVEHGRPCGILTTTDLILTLQCMLQLWLRLSQILQQDSKWSEELDKIAALLEGELSQGEFAAQVKKARNALRCQIEEFVNGIDLHADLLTGIENRRGLEGILEMLVAMQKRYAQPFSLVVVTIDQYDRIHEACGDAVAKPLVKAVAKTIQQAVRTSDYVARCRNDAFAVVLTHTDLQGAEAFCQRLHQMAKHDGELDIPLRICTRAISPEANETAEDLLRRIEESPVPA